MKIFKHLRSEWFRYGFDTLAVGIGILAAFALEEGNGEATIELFDSQGRQIQSHIDKYPGTHTLEMSELKAGIYMVRISLDGKYLSSRRIIKR